MPKLTDLVASSATVVVPFGDVALRVAYRPDVVTPRFQKAVAKAQAESDLDAALLVPVSKLIRSWDLTNDAGDVVPIDPETLADVPVPVLLAVLTAIGEDMAPNPARGGGSSNGSSPRGSEAARQNGTST
jgi:hypothetical protein